MVRDNFTPLVGGEGVVARGFGFIMGASDGCGGGVAKCKSSRSRYVPVFRLNMSYHVKHHG